MQEGWTGFVCGIGFMILVLFAFCTLNTRSENKSFQNVTEKVVLYEKYDSIDLKSRIAAIETGQKRIEGTGCTVTWVGEEVFNGENYIVIVGKKKEAK